MSKLPPPDAGLEKRWCDPFTAQLLDLITDEPGISTAELADRLNQTKGRAGKYLAKLRQAGQLTAMIPKVSNRPYRWTLAGYHPPRVEPEPERIAAMPEPEPEPVAEGIDINNGDDEEADFSITTPHSAQLSKGLTQADLDWHRYWHSRAAQRASDSARRVKSLMRTDWISPNPCDCSHPNTPPCDEPAIYRVENLK